MSLDLEPVITALAEGGLDLTASTQVGLYNERVEQAHQLPWLDSPNDLAMIVGNSRVLWERFLTHLRKAPEWLDREDPLDDYVERIVAAVAEPLKPHRIRFAHRPEPARIAFLELAHVAGLAFRSPGNLCIHGQYGPWLALRAVIVLPTTGPRTTPATSPCSACLEGCQRQLRIALDALGNPLPTHEDLANQWQQFLAIRDACPLGTAHRYSDAQIRYHYTKDREVLRAAVYSASSSSS